MMKKTLLMISILGITLSACSKPVHQAADDIQSTPQTQAAATHEAAIPSIDSEHNAQNSLDWEGLYTGLFPCADCSGIETQLELKPNHQYELTEKYQDKGDGQAFKSAGTFSFDSTGTIITLDQNAEERKFFVAENQLEARDRETGAKIESTLAEHYILTKKTD